MEHICAQFKIKHHNSASYRPKMNGAVEVANKNVKKIMGKMTDTIKIGTKNYLLFYMPIELQLECRQKPSHFH